MASIVIDGIDYNPPGNDVQGEHVLIRNLGAAPTPLTGWTLRDAAPAKTHVYTFPTFTLLAGGVVKVWTKSGADTGTDVYWGLAAAVWNNAGDVALLKDATGNEVSRWSYGLVAPGALPLRLVVPAFWTLEPKFDSYWNQVIQANGVVSAVVIEASWPGTAATNLAWKTQAQAHLDKLPGVVLGYVSTRTGPPNWDLKPAAQISNAVQAWYAQFAAQIDGVYFDELVLPEKLADLATAMQNVTAFKAAHPGEKAMILAGQCPDAAVVGPDVDLAILWEDREPAYRANFLARVGSQTQKIPSWWKDPANRPKIAHVVHACDEPERHRTMSWANERNAGHVFVMQTRGLTDPNDPTSDDLYDRLPPYWGVEVREANSYYDFAFDPQRALLAATRYGTSQGKLHAWPNGEAAWYGVNHVRGTYLLDAGPHATPKDVPLFDLGGNPLFDIPALWSAAHTYARTKGFETAIPTFEPVTVGGNAGVRLVLLATGLSWLVPVTAPLASSAIYEKPTFAEPASVIRNIHRWAQVNGYETALPTFVADDTTNPRGRTNEYNAYGLGLGAPITWQDVPSRTYIEQL